MINKKAKEEALNLAAKASAAIQETLHLLSIPGMDESIKKGLKEPLNKCDDELDW